MSESIIKILQDRQDDTLDAFKKAIVSQIFAQPPLMGQHATVKVIDDPPSPTTTVIGQAAAEIAPRLAEVFGGTAAEWEASIVGRATDYRVRFTRWDIGLQITEPFVVKRRNLHGVISGITA